MTVLLWTVLVWRFCCGLCWCDGFVVDCVGVMVLLWTVLV